VQSGADGTVMSRDHTLSVQSVPLTHCEAAACSAFVSDPQRRSTAATGVRQPARPTGFEVVGQAGSGPDLLSLVRATTPELVVTDIRMPPGNANEGLDAARVIRAELPDTAILVLSAHVDVDQAMELLGSGHGIGYLLKCRVTDVADFIDTLPAHRQRRVGGGPGVGVRAGVRRPTGRSTLSAERT